MGGEKDGGLRDKVETSPKHKKYKNTANTTEPGNILKSIKHTITSGEEEKMSQKRIKWQSQSLEEPLPPPTTDHR